MGGSGWAGRQGGNVPPATVVVEALTGWWRRWISGGWRRRVGACSWQAGRVVRSG